MNNLLTEMFTWQSQTFGDDPERWRGLIKHIRKELEEIEANPFDVEEWADLMFLAADGARRAINPRLSAEGKAAWLAVVIDEKLEKNKARTWPPLSEQRADKACEHDRTKEG